MTIRGQFQNGKIELDESVDVPDGTRVEVRVLANLSKSDQRTGNYPDTSGITMDDFIGCAEGVDASDEAIARYILEKHS